MEPGFPNRYKVQDMAIYQFSCPQDGSIDVAIRVGDEISAHCPVCGNEMKRVYTVPNIGGDLPTLKPKEQ